jgi:hypothetical protein
MKTLFLTLPEFGFIVGTRAALAFGAGLLAANRMPEARRRAVGLTLLAVGAFTTVPAAMAVAGSLRRASRSSGRDARLIGADRFPRKGDDNEFQRM